MKIIIDYPMVEAETIRRSKWLSQPDCHLSANRRTNDNKTETCCVGVCPRSRSCGSLTHYILMLASRITTSVFFGIY